MRPDLGMEMFRNFLEAAHHKKRRGVFREPENKALGDFDNDDDRTQLVRSPDSRFHSGRFPV